MAANIQAEVAKLNQSQRDSLRRAIGGGAIDALNVTDLGWKKRVECQMYGVRHVVEVGPRGSIISREAA